MKPYVLKSHTRPITVAKYNEEGDLLFTAAKDNCIAVCYSSDGERLGTFNGHQGAVWNVDISKDSTRMISASGDCRAKLWDVTNGQELYSWKFQEPTRCCKFAIGDKLIALSTDPFMGSLSALHIVRIADDPAEQTEEVQLSVNCAKKLTRLVWTDQNRTLVGSSEDGFVRRWDVETGAQLAEASTHEASIIDMQESKDGSCVLTASTDKTAKLVDIKSLEVVKTYQHDRPVNSASMHPTNPHVVLAGGQDAASVTTTASRMGGFDTCWFHSVFCQEFGRVRGHFGPVNTVAIAPDGSGFVTGGEDGFVRLQHFGMDYLNTQFF